MKNGIDNLKEKAIKANELENISGGSQAGSGAKCVIDKDKCANFWKPDGHVNLCRSMCNKHAITSEWYNGVNINKINPELCNGCVECWYYNDRMFGCKAISYM
jgi:ferredoxin